MNTLKNTLLAASFALASASAFAGEEPKEASCGEGSCGQTETVVLSETGETMEVNTMEVVEAKPKTRKALEEVIVTGTARKYR